MSDIATDTAFFWSGLIGGMIWAILLWLHLPGQTLCPTRFASPLSWGCLILAGGGVWTLWSPVFGLVGAFFSLLAWSMTMLCLMPILWAILSLYQQNASS